MFFIDHLIDVSVKALVASCFLLVLHRIIKNRIRAKWLVYLWTILIVLLFLPKLPNSPVSMYRLLPQDSTQVQTLEITSVSLYDGEIPNIGFSSEHDFNALNLFPYQVSLIIWALGLTISLGYYGIGFVFIHRSLRSSKNIGDIHIEFNEITYGSTHRKVSIKCIYSDSIRTPALWGWIKPIVLFPNQHKKTLNSSQLEHVLLHEWAHWKRKDHWLQGIIIVLKSVYWFHLPVLFCLKKIAEDMELATDDLVQDWLKGDHSLSYAQTLLTCSKLSLHRSPTSEIAFIKDNQSLTERRLMNMIEPKKKGAFKTTLIVSLLLCFTFALLTNASETPTNNSKLAEKKQLGSKMIEITPKSNIVQNSLTTETVNWQWVLRDDARITVPFGEHNRFNKTWFHDGVDLAAHLGTKIYAPASGEVIYSQFDNHGYGELLIIDHGDGKQSYYAHMDERLVEVGAQVEAGSIIGAVGNTGKSTGPHLHFEVHVNDELVDPLNNEFMNTPESVY